MTTMVSQITSLTVVNSIIYLGADQRKHQSSASLAFVRGIHRDWWVPRTKASNAENFSIWWRHHDKSITQGVVSGEVLSACHGYFGKWSKYLSRTYCYIRAMMTTPGSMNPSIIINCQASRWMGQLETQVSLYDQILILRGSKFPSTSSIKLSCIGYAWKHQYISS